MGKICPGRWDVFCHVITGVRIFERVNPKRAKCKHSKHGAAKASSASARSYKPYDYFVTSSSTPRSNIAMENSRGKAKQFDFCFDLSKAKLFSPKAEAT